MVSGYRPKTGRGSWVDPVPLFLSSEVRALGPRAPLLFSVSCWAHPLPSPCKSRPAGLPRPPPSLPPPRARAAGELPRLDRLLDSILESLPASVDDTAEPLVPQGGAAPAPAGTHARHPPPPPHKPPPLLGVVSLKAATQMLVAANHHASV